jgi:hypothetical protein
MADPQPCDGHHDAVRIVDQTGASADACLLHGAVLLASLDDGRVYPLNGKAFDFLTREVDATHRIESGRVDREVKTRSGWSGSGNASRSRWIEDTVSAAMGDA